MSDKEVIDGFAQNVIKTTTEQNLAAAKMCKNVTEGVNLFADLEHANDRGTTSSEYRQIEAHFPPHPDDYHYQDILSEAMDQKDKHE
tara:strand:+ start:1059 stop:1319 length:261 start_codon:yes stop_codon:yes gene_type:complete